MSLPASFTIGSYQAYSQANVAAFVNAISLRSQSLVGNVSGAISPPAVGTYIGAGFIAGLQSWVQTNCVFFTDPAFAYDGLNVSGMYSGALGWATISANTWVPNIDGGASPCLLKRAGCTASNVDGKYYFSRKRYATISSAFLIPAAYDDTMLNTANDPPAVGAVARHSTTGKIYINTVVGAAHAWVLAADQTQLPTIITGWGDAVAGDINSVDIWSQLAAAIKLLTVSFVQTASNLGGQDKGRYGGGSSDPTSLANAEAAAIASWSLFPAPPTLSQQAYAWSGETIPTGAVGGVQYGAGMEKTIVKNWVVPPFDVAQTWGSSRTFQWLNYSRTLQSDSMRGSGIPPPINYSVLGDTVPAQDTLQLWLTDSPGTAAQIKASDFLPTGPGGATPPRAPDWGSTFHDGDAGQNNYLDGYELGPGYLRVVWDFGD